MGISIAAALLSAALFALTTNLQRVAASAVPEDCGSVALLRRLLVDRRWLLGGLIGTAALALHTLALGAGSVLVVQSVMAVGLVLALGLEAIRDRRPLLPRELGGAVLVVTGVAAVVAVGRPASAAEVAERVGVVPTCVAVVLTALALIGRSRKGVGGPARARLLAAVGGACLAVDAVFLQAAATAARSPAGWWSTELLIGLLGFAGASMVGTLAVQRAYQAAPLRCVQPAVAATEPVTAFLIGVTLLHEGVRWGAVGFVVLVAGIAAIVTGILAGITRTSTGICADVDHLVVTDGAGRVEGARRAPGLVTSPDDLVGATRAA